MTKVELVFVFLAARFDRASLGVGNARYSSTYLPYFGSHIALLFRKLLDIMSSGRNQRRGRVAVEAAEGFSMRSTLCAPIALVLLSRRTSGTSFS